MYRIIKQNNEQAIPLAVETLRKGGLVVYPTETCYGLGADATNQKAVDKLLKYKTRREGKPLSIAVADRSMAERFSEINNIAGNLYDNYLPGPLTVVSKAKGRLADGIASEYKTVGIRLPDYPLVIKLIRTLGRPITATSANVSYQKKPYRIEDLLKTLPKKQTELLDLIIDAGPLPKNEVSTVVDTTLNSLNVLREGQIEFREKGQETLRAVTRSAQETVEFGAMTALKYHDLLRKKCLLFALGGELGAGKTQFTKGIALQMGITKTVTSPTFTLVAEYPYSQGSLSGLLVHIDTWRLSSEEELEQLGIDSFLLPGNIVVVEWADKYFRLLKNITESAPVKLLKIVFSSTSPEERVITVEELS